MRRRTNEEEEEERKGSCGRSKLLRGRLCAGEVVVKTRLGGRTGRRCSIRRRGSFVVCIAIGDEQIMIELNET